MPAKKIDERNLAFSGALGRVFEQSKLNKSEIAEKVGITRNTLYRYRENPGSMTLENFRIMARELRFTDTEILRSIK